LGRSGRSRSCVRSRLGTWLFGRWGLFEDGEEMMLIVDFEEGD
jgi:hypothetical protein